MKVEVKYDSKGVYGIEQSQQFYVAQAKSDNDGLQLVFNFPTRACDKSGYLSISNASLHLTKTEAEELLAVLASFLNHPNNQGKTETWVTFREMPLIQEKSVLEELEFIWNKDEDFPKVKVTNLSKFHISEVTCSVTHLARETNRKTLRYEYESQKIESKIVLSLAPKESIDFYFSNLPETSKIENIEVKKGNGHKIDRRLLNTLQQP